MLFFNHIGHYFAWKQGQSPAGSSWTGQYSYEFDGVNENISLKDFPTIASDYSFSFWFKTTDAGANNYILGGLTGTYSINMNFGQLQVTSTDNSFDIIGTPVAGYNDGEWHMAAYTYNRTSGAFKCYVDGVLKVSQTATTGVDLPIFTRLGSNNPNTNFYAGRIDEFVIFTSELDAADVTTLYNNSFPAEVTSPAPNNYMYLGDGDAFVKALDLDGVNEYITYGNVLDKEKTDAFSLSTWVTINSNHIGAVISKENSASPFEGYILYLSTNKFVFYLSGDNTGTDRISRDSSGTFNLGELYHIACTYDGSNTSSGINFYVNGVLANGAVQGTSIIGNMSNNIDFNIGARNNGNVPFDGKIGYTAVFNSELSAGDISTLYNSGLPKLPSLLSIVSEAEWDLTKNFKKSLTFDGVNEVVDFGNNIDFDGTGAFSYSFWISPNSTSGFKGIISKYDTVANQGYLVQQSGAGLIFYIANNVGTNEIRATVSAGLFVGSRRHILWTYDGSKTLAGMKVYMNGVLQSMSATIDTLTGSVSNLSSLYLGSINNSTQYYDGEIYNVSVFNTELTSGNATTLYNNGTPKPATELGLSPSNQWNMFDETTDYWDGSEIIINDSVGSINGTSVNMEEADITDYAWTVYDEVGSIDGLSVNMESTDASNIGWAVEDSVGTLQGLSENMEEADRKMGVGYSANFNDGVTGELINWGNVLDKDGSEDFSISIWVWADITSMPTDFLEWLGKRGSGAGWTFRANSSETISFLIGDGTNWNNTRPSVDFNMVGWNHWVVCYDSSKAASDVRWYRNGVLKTNSILIDTYSGGGSSSNTDSLRLGSWFGEPSIKATRLSIHNKKLNQLEVNKLYNNGVPATAFEAGLSDSAELDCIMFGSEDTATTIKDYSSNGYDGTLVNMDLTNKSSDTP